MQLSKIDKGLLSCHQNEKNDCKGHKTARNPQIFSFEKGYNQLNIVTVWSWNSVTVWSWIILICYDLTDNYTYWLYLLIYEPECFK